MALFGPRKDATLKVQGMHCANCTKTVGDALRSVPGVVSANVDLLFHRASVRYDPEKVDEKALVDAVKASGYDATLNA